MPTKPKKYRSDTPPPPPPPISPKPPIRTVDDPRHGAKVVREGYGPSIGAVLSGGVSSVVGVPGFQKFREELLKDLGNPNDPVAVMFIDQLCWLHLRSGSLLAAGTDGALQPASVAALTAAATRLIAEFRKSALALREYQSPIRQPTNVTINASAQVAVVEAPAAASEPAAEILDVQVSKPPEALANEPFDPFILELESRRRGPPEPLETRAADRSGEAAAAGSRVAEPPVAGGRGEPPTSL